MIGELDVMIQLRQFLIEEIARCADLKELVDRRIKALQCQSQELESSLLQAEPKPEEGELPA